MDSIHQLLHSLTISSTAEDDVDKLISSYQDALSSLKSLLEHHMTSRDVINKSSLRRLAIDVVYYITSHMQHHYWTNETTITSSNDVLEFVYKLCGCQNVCEFLIGKEYNESMEDDDDDRLIFSNGILQSLMDHLMVKLHKSKLRQYPNAKYALLWTIKNIKHPLIGSYLHIFIPPLLVLMDDHDLYHKRIALSGFYHIIINTDGPVLKAYGRADLIYEAINNQLYSNDVDVINSLHHCLLVLLPIINGTKERNISRPVKANETDKVFVKFLHIMEVETRISLRSAYINHVVGYVNILGIFIVRYLDKILHILHSYMEYGDVNDKTVSLKILLHVMGVAWPRISAHSSFILQCLIKLMESLCPMDGPIDTTDIKSVTSLIVHSLIRLSICDVNIKDVYNQILADNNHILVVTCIKHSIMN
jgi:hypothetical protein